MEFFEKLKINFKRFEDCLFTNHACLACRREVPDGTEFSLCDFCKRDIRKIDGKICCVCGEKIDDENSICENCKSVKFYFDKNFSYAYYDETISQIVKRLKYSNKKYYARYIAEMMAQNYHIFKNIDILTFVPISVKRFNKRGFNQSEEIAIEISKLVNIPVIGLLEKVGSEKHQAGLTQKQRRENLKDSFSLKNDYLEHVKGKRVIVIDDVFTTGSTMSECAKTLKSNKDYLPKEVYGYTFAKTDINSTNND